MPITRPWRLCKAWKTKGRLWVCPERGPGGPGRPGGRGGDPSNVLERAQKEALEGLETLEGLEPCRTWRPKRSPWRRSWSEEGLDGAQNEALEAL